MMELISQGLQINLSRNLIIIQYALKTIRLCYTILYASHTRECVKPSRENSVSRCFTHRLRTVAQVHIHIYIHTYVRL